MCLLSFRILIRKLVVVCSHSVFTFRFSVRHVGSPIYARPWGWLTPTENEQRTTMCTVDPCLICNPLCVANGKESRGERAGTRSTTCISTAVCYAYSYDLHVLVQLATMPRVDSSYSTHYMLHSIRYAITITSAVTLLHRCPCLQRRNEKKERRIDD